MTFDRIGAHLAEAARTLDYSLAQLDGDPDTIADIEDVIAGLRELRLEIEVQTSSPSPAASESDHTDTRVVWIHQIVERDPNPLAIPPRPSLKHAAIIRFDLRVISHKALPAALKIANPVQTVRQLQPTLTRTADPKSRDDTHI